MSIFPASNIGACETILKYTFENKNLLASALNASGNTYILHGNRVGPNKRLAVYGDVKMTSILSAKWYENSGLTLADWAEIRSSILITKHLGQVGKTAGLETLVVTQAKEVSANMMAAVVQAIAGALYHDAGNKGDEVLDQFMTQLGIVSPLLQDHGKENQRPAAESFG